MDPHDDFDKHDCAPYDIAPATNVDRWQLQETILRQDQEIVNLQIERTAADKEIERIRVEQVRMREALEAVVGAYRGREISAGDWPLMDQVLAALSTPRQP